MPNEILDAPETRRRRTYPNLKQSFGLLGYSILIQLVAGLVFAPALIYFQGNAVMEPLIFLLLYVLMFGFLLWFAQRQRKENQGVTNFNYGAIPVLAYPILFLLTISSGLLIEPLVELIPLPIEYLEEIFGIISGRDIFTFLAIVVAAPVFEELIFRGVIMDGLLKNSTPTKAIFWSAFIFGVVHMNPWQFVGAFFIGLVIGWVYWKTRSLWPCIFMHAVNNGMAFFFQFIEGMDGEEALLNSTRTFVGASNYMIVLAIGTLLTVLCFWLLNGMFSGNHFPES